MATLDLCWAEPAAIKSNSFLDSTSFNIVMNTTAGRFDSNYSRAAISTTLNNRFFLDAKSDLTDFWLHFDMYSAAGAETGTTPINGIPSIIFHSSDGNPQYRFTLGNGVNSSWYLLKTIDGTNWTVIDAVSTLVVSLRHVIDIHIKISPTVGQYELFQNGVQLRNFTGDTSSLNNAIRYINMGSGSVAIKDYSQIILANESTVGWKLSTISPTADGGIANWTNTFAQINSIPYTNNKDTGLHTNSLVQHSFVASDITVTAAGLTVDSVWSGCRGYMTSDSTIQGVYPMLRSGGINYINTNKILSVTDGSETVEKIKWSVNPVNGSGWTQNDVNILEYGVSGGM
jgi:hypothetical protein